MTTSHANCTLTSRFMTLSLGVLFQFAAPPAMAELAVTAPMVEFPALPHDGDFLGIPDTMSIAVQEDIFVQREMLEGFLGENLIAVTTAPDYTEQLRVMGKLGPAARPIDIDRARWRMERIALTGDISRRMSELTLRNEEFNLIKL